MTNVSVRRAARRSLESVNVPVLEEARLSEIARVESPTKRAGLLALHNGVRLLVGRQSGLRHLQSGAQSDVYIEGDSVLKVVKEQDADRQPVTFTKRERHEAADRLREEHAIMTDYLGQAVVPHSIAVASHPLRRFQSAIVIAQPFRELDFIDLDATDQRVSLAEKLQRTRQAHPHAIGELTTVLVRSRQMAGEQNLWTDIVGRDNMGMSADSGRLEIVDCQPVPPTRPADLEVVMGRFEVLEQALASVA
jgi:hypothetical protein